jgi:arsenite oxidase large subunit
LRLYEQIQDPPGDAMPDWAIMGRIAQRLHTLYRADGDAAMADRFSGFEWTGAEEVFLEGGKAFRRWREPPAMSGQGRSRATPG